jgi:hypothetical protein
MQEMARALRYSSRLTRLAIRLSAMLAFTLTALSAQALDVAFSGSGLVSGPAQTPPLFTQLAVAPESTHYTVNGDDGWTLGGQFEFNVATLAGSGAGMLAKGADSLSLSFASTTASLGAPLALTYTVTGGTGIYSGLFGGGSSTVQLLGNPLGLPTPIPFTETNGTLNLSPVPEPSTFALMVLGIAGLVSPDQQDVSAFPGTGSRHEPPGYDHELTGIGGRSWR